jgi:hypothetical protein
MTTVQETVQRYLQIWNQRDAAARRAGVRGVFSEACTYTDPMAAVTGHEAIDGFIGFDVVVLDGERIKHVLGFLDKAPG